MRFLFLALTLLCFSGCATVFEGYKSDLEIVNPPPGLQVSTLEGVDLPIIPKTMRFGIRDSITGNMKYSDRQIAHSAIVRLRSNKDYVLILKYGSVEKRIEVSPKLTLWWFLLDFVFGVLPLIPDAATGNWNYFEPVYIDK